MCISLMWSTVGGTRFLALAIFPPFDLCLSFVMRLDYSTYSTVLVLWKRRSTAGSQINMQQNCTFDFPSHAKYSSGGRVLANYVLTGVSKIFCDLRK